MKIPTTLVILLFALASFASSQARADATIFKRAGGWEAWAGRSDDGRKLCGLSARGGGRWIGVKYFAGEERMTIHLSKTTWRAKRGEQVEVIMKFDAESPWTATATAFLMSDGDVGLEFSIPLAQVQRWFTEFRRSDTLYVGFPNDNIDDWQADLAGTPDVSDAMGDCIRAMGRYRD